MDRTVNEDDLRKRHRPVQNCEEEDWVNDENVHIEVALIGISDAHLVKA